MKLLLDMGFDPNVVDKNGDSLLIKAIRDNKKTSFNTLMQYDIDLNQKNAN